jgi:phage shock protein PspC (stress-responsive transcriptional regulator)
MNETKKLYRNTDNKVFAGVCSGIAEYYSTDVIIIRAIFIATGLVTGGTAVLLYLILYVWIPERPSSSTPVGKN